jgi:hypothetical protein
MYENFKPGKLIEKVRKASRAFPDVRTGENCHYQMEDAAMSALSVFFTQSPSFLANQREMKTERGRSNAESLFALHEIPSDNQIRNLLDAVDPHNLRGVYREIVTELEDTGLLKGYRSYANQLLIVIDGTEYFSSKKIHCGQCNRQVLANGETRYFHRVLTPVIVQPGNARVIALEPEFIVPQDGQEKQDCELNAAKRWVGENAIWLAQQGVTILGDDLFSRSPFCRLLQEKKVHFLLVCKPDSHAELYQTVAFLERNAVLGSRVIRRWVGKYAEIDTYRYANLLRLYAQADAPLVNWVELTTTREDTGQILYKNAWITDFEITQSTLEAIVRDARARWKVENENNNVLKTHGYHLEHNFGHGSQHLASLLLSLNLLAFLFHTLLDLVNEQYRAIRRRLGSRRTFFQDLEALLRYFDFSSWENLFGFMFAGLQLDSG